MRLIFFILFIGYCELASSRPLVVAHRGSHHSYQSVVPPSKCRQLKGPQRHLYIENTLDSIENAFLKGADIVEIDIVATKDFQLVLSHESDLDCYTSGTGKIHEKNLRELKDIDVGFNYTFDGVHFPFRGKGKSKFTTLNQVVSKFPNRLFLINPKDQPRNVILKAMLENFKGMPTKNFYFWGDREIYDELSRVYPLNKYVSIPNRQIDCYQFMRRFFMFGFLPNVCKEVTFSLFPEQLVQSNLELYLFKNMMRNGRVSVWLFLPHRVTEITEVLNLDYEAVIVSNIDQWRP